MKEVINTQAAPAAIGPYSQAIKSNGTLYISGQIPVNPESGKIEAESIEGQAEQSLKNIGEILKQAGLSYDDVVKTTCFIANMEDFGLFNEVYAKFFSQKSPARSCVAVKELPKGALCEVEAIAAK